jgi:desulfoferrodoxin (superoxide reductase-like protein)
LAAFRELATRISPDASIAATSREVPHLSNRKHAYSLQIGYFDADYILVRRKLVSGKEPARKHYEEALASGRYRKLASKNIFVLWKRSDEVEAQE